MTELDPTQIIKDKDCIYFQGEKYQKVKEPPRMYLENEGKFVIVTYNHKIYYRTETPATFVWWVVNYNTDNQRRLEVVSDAETERLLEGIYFNDVKRGTV